MTIRPRIERHDAGLPVSEPLLGQGKPGDTFSIRRNSGIMIFISILAIAMVLGVIPAMIANSKGQNFIAWWMYGAALFIIALPHSLLINADVQQIERQQLQSGDARKCPFCAEIIKAEAKVCRYCGRDLPRGTVKNANDAALDNLITDLQRRKQTRR